MDVTRRTCGVQAVESLGTKKIKVDVHRVDGDCTIALPDTFLELGRFHLVIVLGLILGKLLIKDDELGYRLSIFNGVTQTIYDSSCVVDFSCFGALDLLLDETEFLQVPGVLSFRQHLGDVFFNVIDLAFEVLIMFVLLVGRILSVFQENGRLLVYLVKTE